MLDIKRIDEIAANVSLSVSIEGLHPSIEAQEISKLHLRGELSDTEAKRRILFLHGIIM